MSISLLSHRLVFRKKNTLPLDLEDQMRFAFRLGRQRGDDLVRLSFRAIENHSRKLPEGLWVGTRNYACNRAIAAAYYHGISTKLLAAKMPTQNRQETLKLAARTQRLVLQLIVSIQDLDILRLQKPTVLPDWAHLFVGALSVARVAKACHDLGFEVRYPRPVVDACHFIDLFCSLEQHRHLAIQVKTGTGNKVSVVDDNTRGPARRFRFAASSIVKSAQKRGDNIVTVWALCSRQQSGLDCGELRTSFDVIARTWMIGLSAL
ncbi:hypothetical protein [Pedobacter sp.]|jgi:hypothetical protein|uniref:hypothetical protein n=1 Tax=Pedobacter sp. TaxID=1411316 RepID=UPI002C7D0293|nr:hypothetical protein [Pedobacter sp.]HWW42003.1 hypothetical protein [Pedobacter sp.]